MDVVKISSTESENEKMCSKENISSEMRTEHKHCGGCLRINLTYLPLKLLYLFLMAGQASCLIYQNIFMRHLGLSTAQVGLISAAQRILGIFTPPICGAVSDKTGKPKLVLIFILLISAVLVFAMVFVPIEKDAQLDETGLSIESTVCEISQSGVKGQCNATYFNRTHLKVTTTEITQLSSTTPFPPTNSTRNEVLSQDNDRNSTLNKVTLVSPVKGTCSTRRKDSRVSRGAELICDTRQEDDLQDDEYGVTFWLMTILSLLTAFTFNGTMPVVEATAFAILGPRNKHKHGRQRLWASVGYGISSFVIGFTKTELAKIGSPDSNMAYVPIFGAALVFLSLSALVSYKLPIENPSGDPVSLAKIKMVMRNPKMINFLLLLVFPYGIGNGILLSYSFWFVEEKLGASTTIIGLSTLCGSTIDIPCFFASGWLILKFRHNPLLVVSVAVMSIRLFLMAKLTAAWQIIIVEGMRGITWGLGWAVICSFASSISPPELRATTVGIVYATSHGIGFAIGALAGGVVYQKLSGEFLFTTVGWFVAVTMALYIVTVCWRHVTSARRKRREGSEAERKFELNRDANANEETKT